MFAVAVAVALVVFCVVCLFVTVHYILVALCLKAITMLLFIFMHILNECKAYGDSIKYGMFYLS